MKNATRNGKKLEIAHLIASGDATQITAIFDVNQTVFNIDRSSGTKYDSELIAELTKFLISVLPPKQLAQTENMPSPLNEGPSQRHTKSSTNLSQDLFSVLQPFRGEYERIAASYKRSQGSAIGARYRWNRDLLDDWLRLRDSKILPIIAPPEEATKLTLEVVELIDFTLTSQSSANCHIIRLTHLCGENSNSKREKPNIMVLDLIAQVMAHQERYGRRSCSVNDLAAMEKEGVKRLWEIFWERVQQAGIKYLLVFLDNVDKLFLASEKPTEDIQEALPQLVRNLKPSNSRPGILIKAMVTCKESEMAECFELPTA